MAKRIALIYSAKAFRDIDRIIEFNDVRNRSNRYSQNFLTGLKNRLEKLTKQPLSGLKTDTNSFLLIWDKYYIFYIFDGEKIIVTSIYHQREDIVL